MSDTLIDEGVAPGDASVAGDDRLGALADRARSWLERLIPWLAHDDDSVDEGGERGARWQRVSGWVVAAICTFIVIVIIDPHTRLWPIWSVHFGWIFRNTTTNGGDMGAHVWLPWFLEHNWFPKFRLAGWAPAWYAGFPVGQYYFPFPSVMVAILNLAMPYDVAFKLVTVSGPIMLPIAAYSFARGMRAPFPAAPAFSIAALGMLLQERTSWNIYGGNIASTLAGEYSFEIALAFALFALGALAYTLDTGKRRWVPAVLFAMAVMSHIVVAIFVGVAAVLLWLVRSPRRTWPIAVAVGAVGTLLTAVWSLPLLGQQAYTQSMRYAKVFSTGSSFKVPYWIFIPNPVKHTIEGIVRGVAINRDPSTGKVIPPTLWLPWWIWILAGVAIIAAGWYRRRSTFVLLLIALAFGVFFVQWPEHAVWNTRFLPFWLLMWGFLAAMGAAELARLLAGAATWAFRWVSDGDLEDVRARAWADVALDDRVEIPQEVRNRAVRVLAERHFDSGPPGWEPPTHLDSEHLARRSRAVTMCALAVIVGIGSIFGIRLAWSARNGNPDIRVAGWAQYNYGGYQSQASWPEFRSLIETMNSLPPGRAMWEGGDAVGNYGTTLAPELLPYFTKGRIDSMEGLYFESSATTSFHFMTISELAKSPSNPVRGLEYGSNTSPTDFALGVKHLQLLGVSYLMLFSKESEAMAADQPDLELIKTVPDLDGADPKGWDIYRVRYPDGQSPLVTGLSSEPVVASVHAGNYQQCWGQPWTDSSPTPKLGPWECAAAPWFMDAAELDKVWAASGPKSWKHIDIKQLPKTTETAITPTHVTQIHETVDTISFHVSDVGKPVLVRTSYFPNWQVKGASGPYRVAPNFMVVVPTSHDVKLTYGLTSIDWLGRIGTLLGLVGLGGLVAWKGLDRYRATGADDDRDGDAGGPGDDGHGGGGGGEPGPAPVSAESADEASEPEIQPVSSGVPPP